MTDLQVLNKNNYDTCWVTYSVVSVHLELSKSRHLIFRPLVAQHDGETEYFISF